MTPTRSGSTARTLAVALAASAMFFVHAGARAQEPHSPVDGEAVLGSTQPSAAPGAAVAPRVSSMVHDWIGTGQSQFRLTIIFSQTVTGFELADIEAHYATPASELTGSGRRYTVDMNTQADFKGTVIITIAQDAAVNAAGEGSIPRVYTLEADNRPPLLVTARINADELIVTFDEDLNPNFVRSDAELQVSTRPVFKVLDISGVRILAKEMILSLDEAALPGQEVRLYYHASGAGALRDMAGNLVHSINDEPVTNLTMPGEAPGPPQNLTATSAGETAIQLEWTAPDDDGGSAITGYRIEVSADAGDTWDILERSTNSTETRYTHTGLSAATTRHYRVSARNSRGAGDPSNEAGATTVGRVPHPPTRLTATARGTSVIELDWNAPAHSPAAGPVTSYRIEASATGTGRWTVLEANTQSGATSYRHTDLEPGTTNHYRVMAINDAGRSGPSNVAHATTEAAPPGAPTGLAAAPSGPGGRSEILLTWTAPSSDGGAAIVGYRIEVSSSPVSGWTALAANTRTAATRYTHTGLAPGTTRHYRVAAINAEGTGDHSNVATGTTNTGTPSAPQSLRALATGPAGIELTWRAPATNAGSAVTGYRIRRRAPGGSWTTIRNNTGSTATSFEDTGLRPATAYSYQVAAVNALGAGPWTPEVSTRTRADVPGAPANLAARAAGTTRINLSWTVPSNDGGSPVLGYRIEVSANGGTSWRILRGNTGSPATTFAHTGLGPGTRRDYRVSAINAAGVGRPSSSAHATTEAVVPGAPRRLTARADGSSAIRLSWDAPASDGGASVTGYRIEASRSRTGGWTVIRDNTGSSATTHRHTGLEARATWHYRVSAINGRGVGPTSGVATGTTAAAAPGQPRMLRAVAAGANAIDVSWSAPESDGGASVTGYRIEAATAGAGPWTTLVANSGSTATAYSHTSLPPATTRFYRVSAINAAGAGRPAGPVSATTLPDLPGAPTGLRASARGASQIALSWTAPAYDGGSAVRGYRIESSADGGATWTIVRRDTGSPATTFTHANLQPGTTRHYRVSAVNLRGAGRASGVASATTEAAVPNAPRNLSARANGTSRIDLSWDAPASDGGARITGYRIEASADGGNTWAILRSTTGSTATNFAHSNLQPGTTRRYRVSAINRVGTGRASGTATATTDAVAPNAPRNLSARANGTSRIDLSWDAPASDGGARITGYRIEVSDDLGSWRDLVADTRSRRTTHPHTGLQPGTTRHYRVSAINRIGIGRASGIASGTSDATVPDAPTGLMATATGPDRIDLSWTAPAYDGGAAITGYRVEVSETGAAWRDLVANTGAAGTAYAHTGLLPGTRRHYRVSAINRAGAGAPSGVASATTDDPVQRAGRLNARVLPHVAAAMTSSTVSAIADRIDAVASGMGTRRRIEMGGLSAMAADFASPRAGGSALGPPGRSGAGPLLAGMSFQLPLGASDAPQQARGGGRTTTGRTTTWGAGEYHRLGEPEAAGLDWSGSMISAHVGADVRIAADIVAGVAASHSSGTFDFTDNTGASGVSGVYGTAMTTVNPYVGWLPDGRGSAVWGTAGFGWGDVEVDDERASLRVSPARMMTGAAGGSYQLLGGGVGGLRLKAEGWAARVMVDDGERIESVTLDMQRGKLALEWTQGYRSTQGHEVALLLEGGARYDNGDGANGAGAEVGGGLRYSHARIGLTAEGRGRLLVAGREGYQEWGFGGMVQLDRASRGQGLQIRLAPSYGEAASGVDELWNRGVADAVGERLLRPGASLNAEVAYRLPGLRGAPYGGLQLHGGGRAFSSGLRYDLGAGLGLRIEGTRRESALGASSHTVGVRGALKIR